MANKKVVKKSNGLLVVSVALLLAFLSTAAAVVILIFTNIYLRESLGAMGDKMRAISTENESLKQENGTLRIDRDIHDSIVTLAPGYSLHDEVSLVADKHLYQLIRSGTHGDTEVIYEVEVSSVFKVFGLRSNNDGSSTFSIWKGGGEGGTAIDIAFNDLGFDVLRTFSNQTWGTETLEFHAILYPAHDTVDLYVTEECSQEQGATAEVSGVVLSSSISTQVVPHVFALPIAKRVPCIDVDGQMTTPLFSNIVTTASGIDFLLPTGDRARLTIEANESGQEYEANVVFNQ